MIEISTSKVFNSTDLIISNIHCIPSSGSSDINPGRGGGVGAKPTECPDVLRGLGRVGGALFDLGRATDVAEFCSASIADKRFASAMEILVKYTEP